MARRDDADTFERDRQFEQTLGKRELVLSGIALFTMALAGFVTRDAFPICLLIYALACALACTGMRWILRQSDSRFDGVVPPKLLLVMKLAAYLSSVALPIGVVGYGLSRWVLSSAAPLPDFADELNAFGAIASVLLPTLEVPTQIWSRRAVVSLAADEGALKQVAALERLAYQDPLTGLANRRCFEEALTQLGADGQEFAVMFVDFDKFKPINDEHGHAVGDEFLKAIAQRIQSLVRHGDLVARLGGDEFAVLIKGGDAHGASTQLAERFTRAMHEPVACTGVDLRSTASVGIAVGRTGVDDCEHVVHRADMAMYEAKRAGGARFCMAGL
ncbi:GGDEF domain-containing protein [Roseateles puraquae]|jgi:diguanylate cyclase (GGDEF)-like protein|uniref:GGDEF domain-containing protein n=1 Tax=Roseateles puraquae TaxID=431059 RepID=UPI0031E3EC65